MNATTRFPRAPRVTTLLAIAACTALAPLALGAGCVAHIHSDSAHQPFWGSSERFEEERVVTIPHIDRKPVNITTRNGDITVVRTDADAVTITATVKASSESRARQINVIVSRLDDDTLEIEPEFQGGYKRHDGVDIRLEIPNAMGVSAKSSNGAILVHGLAGDATLDTSNGRVTVEQHEGAVHARTSNGRLTFTSVTGTIDAKTSNGRVELSGPERDVTVRTSNGRITVDLAPEFTGVLSLDTSNGQVSVGVGEHLRGTLEASTSNGSVSVESLGRVHSVRTDDGRNKGRATFEFGGAPEPHHRVRTSNGSVTLRATTVPPKPVEGEQPRPAADAHPAHGDDAHDADHGRHDDEMHEG